MSAKLVRESRGFTVMELMLAVMAFLLIMSIVLINVAKQQAKRRDVTRAANINQLQKALDLYATEFQQYPIYTGCIFGDDDLIKELRSKKYFDKESRLADPKVPIERSGCYYYVGDGSAYRLRYVMETDGVETKGEHFVTP